ncbi:CBS domain-containing protein [candidate division KSB1 bacterium]
MATIRQIIKNKGSEIWSVSPDDTVFNALILMAEKEIGALLVMDNGHVCGILSERDYARKVILKGKSSKELPVKEIMTSDILYVEPGKSVEECMALMTEKRIRHLPVMEDGVLQGIISIGDVVKAVISHKEFMIQQLEKYIHGSF